MEDDATAIPEGKCGVYTSGTGKLSLCIESVLDWGTDLTQVNGYLENTGDVKLCAVKVALGGAPEGFHSVWPEWVREGTWEKDYQPKQISAVGLTVPYKVGAPAPTIKVESFTTCGDEAKAAPIAFQLVDISDLKRVGAVSAVDQIRTPAKQAQQVPPAAPGANREAGTAAAGRCTTYGRGYAKLVFCVDAPAQWGKDIVQVAGEVQNIGEVPVCDLVVSNNVAKKDLLSSWPEWTASSARMEEKFFPGEKMSLGKESIDAQIRPTKASHCISSHVMSTSTPPLSNRFHFQA